MSGDYSRYRFGAKNSYVGVKMQQGRVQLDADWNEWVDAIDRRNRAETVDTFGIAGTPGIGGVAVVSPLTPDGFLIEVSGGSFTIGEGRMYVDGLLAENFGDPDGSQAFDPVLAEKYGEDPIAYDQQPYHPDPAALPGGGPHLAYLEVWQREVTHLQRPELVERAVGVDTTTRTQIVWQVRLLENISAGITCTSPDTDLAAAWDDLTSPSAGRLSSRDVEFAGGADPCELPPSSGYRGLENQLYRVEIHTGGNPGSATFKWSRDNASVAASVTEVISSVELKLASLGRDAVLRFNSGDWVEIVDDWRELSGDEADPMRRFGEMRKITVNDAKQTITFSPALPANLVPTDIGDDTLEKRHLRVIRWDQKGEVRDSEDNLLIDLDAAGSQGVIPVPAAGVWVHLENGVQIAFSRDPVGGEFRCNDFWNMAARASDNSLETLSSVPPQGIHRHYARLALVTFPGAETDCREHWPPDFGGGCCDIVVSPGEDIQEAFDALAETGGCVCLRTGVHEITAPLEIYTSGIRFHGESPGVVIRDSSGLDFMLEIGGVDQVVNRIEVESICFETTVAAEESALLYLHDCSEVSVTGCGLAVVGQQLSGHVGILMQDVADVVISDNHMRNLFVGIWVFDFSDRLMIERNSVSGMVYRLVDTTDSNQTFSFGLYGVRIDSDMDASCHVDSNQFEDFQIGIWLRGGARYSQVVNNEIRRTGEVVGMSVPADTTALRAYLDDSVYAIMVDAEQCRIAGNFVELPGAVWGGVRIGADHMVVVDNILHSGSKPSPAAALPAGIYCLGPLAKNSGTGDYSRIDGNRLIGPTVGIVISRVNHVTVENNRIDGMGSGWFGVRVDDCNETRVCRNTIEEVYFGILHGTGEDNHICGNSVQQCGMGITSLQEDTLKVSDNRISQCLMSGILLEVFASANLSNNHVSSCGYSGFISLGITVIAEHLFAESDALVRIEGNEVLDTGIDPLTNTGREMPAIGIGVACPACQISHNRTGYTTNGFEAQIEHRALLLIGPMGFHYDAMDKITVELMFGSAVVTDNHFRGPGRSCLVEFRYWAINEWIDFRFEKVTFNNNVCDHLQNEPAEDGATIRLWGRNLIAMGNHIKAGSNVNSMSLGHRHRVALMGNVTTGDFIRVGTTTPAPLTDFNIRS